MPFPVVAACLLGAADQPPAVWAAARHPEAAWVFIYTREAHPGENVGHHDSFERKLACAKLLAEEAGISREILVDDLDGTVHRAYGLMPDMTWVIGRGGRVAYKANWTSAANVEAFLGRFLAGRAGQHWRSRLRRRVSAPFAAMVTKTVPALADNWRAGQGHRRGLPGDRRIPGSSAVRPHAVVDATAGVPPGIVIGSGLAVVGRPLDKVNLRVNINLEVK